MKCGFCLESGHLKADCPKAKTFDVLRDFGTVEPLSETSTAEDVIGALQDRCHSLRAALRAVIVEARRSSLTLSPETAALVAAADSFDP